MRSKHHIQSLTAIFFTFFSVFVNCSVINSVSEKVACQRLVYTDVCAVVQKPDSLVNISVDSLLNNRPIFFEEGKP